MLASAHPSRAPQPVISRDAREFRSRRRQVVQSQWDASGQELSFETAELRGIFVADCEAAPNNRHRVRQMVHKPTGTRVTPEGGHMEAAGSFTVFRAYARDSWLTELRATAPAVSHHEDGATLVWGPTWQHQAETTAVFTIREPNIIDADISVVGHCHYPDYELLFSNYVSPELEGGVYVCGDALGGADAERIRVSANPAFHGLYNFFPRDERAGHIMTDGRGQRGRWPWRVACGRLYARPLACASNDATDAILMGRPEDVSSVGVTYSAEGQDYDGVAAHHALYLSLFGRDLHPGEGWRTQVRLVVATSAADPEEHLQPYAQFLRDVSGIPRSIEVLPQ